MTGTRPLVALVGRPNVGKSTLFNRILGRRAAIVVDVPGVTRDRNYADFAHDGRALSLVDTGGFEPESKNHLMRQVREQAQLAVEEAAAVVLVVDGREGMTAVDAAVAELLRGGRKPLFIAANKLDSNVTEERLPLAEFHALGIGEVFSISAEHGRGVEDLLDAVVSALALPRAPPEADLEPLDSLVEGADQPTGDVRIAIVGRPNVGKSTLVNALLGTERLVTSEEPGTTRDSIDSVVERRGHRFIVTDTAGIRRKSTIAQSVETYSVVRAMKAIDRAEVVACLLDATEAGVDQDARILGLVIEKARALVLVVNKWDIAEKEGATQAYYRKELIARLPFVSFVPFVFVSAKEGLRVGKVLDEAARLIQQSRARFPTSPLNELLEAIQEQHPAPLSNGRSVKLFYIAQVGYAPPTFAVQCSRPESIPDSYKRFVENRYREAFGLEVPVRFLYRERRRERRSKPHAR